jgi:hypothetical protein
VHPDVSPLQPTTIKLVAASPTIAARFMSHAAQELDSHNAEPASEAQ